MLGRESTPQEVESLLIEMEELFSRMTPGALGLQESLLILVSKIHPMTWKEIRAERLNRRKCDSYESLKDLLREKAKDDHLERYLF